MEKKVKENEPKISSKKVLGLRTLDFFLTILPLVILVIVRHEKYIYSKSSAIGFSAGAVIAFVVIVLTIFKKLHLGGLAISVIGLALCYFLRNLINDLEWIFLCLLIGQVASKTINIFIRREEENVRVQKTAKETSTQIKTVIQTFIGSGRV